MYFIGEKCDPVVGKYLQHRIVSTIEFDKKKKSYICTVRGCRSKKPGLHSSLRRKHYPKYKHSKRKKKTDKKGSSIKQGKTIDNQLNAYIQKKKRPTHRMVKQLIAHWTAIGHTPIAAQLPVYIKKLDCVTQADIVTSDVDGNLWMFEVKSGFPPGGSRKKGTLNAVPGQIANTVYNHWELQRYYTTKGLQEQGLPIHESRVIHVYDEFDKNLNKKVVRVKIRIPPKWVNKYLE